LRGKIVKRRPVDNVLVDLCKAFVAGMNNNADAIPESVSSGSKDTLRKFIYLTSIHGSSVRYEHYEGGMLPDGTYSFLNENEDYDILLTVVELRKVATGELKSVRIEY